MILRAVMHGLWTILGALWLVALAGAVIINCFGRRGGTRREGERMKAVTFKYAPKERVVTPFGDVGIISMAAIEENDTISYYVKGQHNSNWLTEDELKPAEGQG